MVKLGHDDKSIEKELLDDPDLVDLLASNLDKDAIETLAYLSVHASIKEKIVRGQVLTKVLSLATKNNDRPLFYGMASILMNLTAYKKKLSEEEEEIIKLRVMAKDMVQPVEDPLDANPAVEARCRALVKAGLVSALVSLSRIDSVNIKGKFSTDKQISSLIFY